MPYIAIEAVTREDRLATAERRWARVLAARPDLRPAVDLQRRLITLVVQLTDAIEQARLPRLSLPAKYLAAKLSRGVPVFSGEPIPLPVASLSSPLLKLCTELAAGGAGEAADHIRSAIDRGDIDPGSLLSASFSRDERAIRQGAAHRGLAPDLVWLVAELAVSPFAHVLQRALFASTATDAALKDTVLKDAILKDALDGWDYGYCPACGSWPALAEVVGGHRVLRCSFCAAAWELNAYACIYCGETGEAFVTAAPDAEQKNRRVEVCGTCAGYLKTIDST